MALTIAQSTRATVIEFRGQPIGVIKESFRTVPQAAGFSVDKGDPFKIIRHSARHTAITWYLTGLHNREQPVKSKGRRPGKGIDVETVSQYCGVSPTLVRKHYLHETEGTCSEPFGTGTTA